MITTIKYLKEKSLSLYKQHIIIKERDLNWKIVYYKFINYFLNLLNVFFIFFFVDTPNLCFILIFLTIIIENILISIFFSKIFFKILLIYFFISGFFFLWVVLVYLDKVFFIQSYYFCDFFYVMANLMKLFSIFIMCCTLYKIKKKIKNGCCIK